MRTRRSKCVNIHDMGLEVSLVFLLDGSCLRAVEQNILEYDVNLLTQLPTGVLLHLQIRGYNAFVPATLSCNHETVQKFGHL